jgi:signal transduction histidine kinase
VVLRHGGLRAGIRALARRSPIPVEVDIPQDLDLPDPVEVAAYYVASEALTNAAKHAHAESVEIRVSSNERELELTIRDDGVGGARVGTGSGLIGLTDRVQAAGGRIEIASPQGGGTTLHVSLPLAAMNSS